MFEKGQYIIYGSSGVCLVADVSIPDSDSMGDGKTLYYTLAPIRDSGRIFIPVTTTKFMRPVISREQAMELIARIPSIRKDEYQPRDHRMLAEHYKQSMGTHDCTDLIQLIKTIYLKNEDLAQRGKKASNTDLQYLKRAEELLHSELSIALEIPFGEVESFIAREIERLNAPVNE
ncbi:MAG: CarD family transcriptional regulator [Firmicutes bacterium]|nr:CarD family transcriptional regulator [Bacillota bacterium]